MIIIIVIIMIIVIVIIMLINDDDDIKQTKESLKYMGMCFFCDTYFNITHRIDSNGNTCD